MNLGQARTRVRVLAQDADVTGNSVSTTDVNGLINEAIWDIGSLYPEETIGNLGSVVLAVNENTGVMTVGALTARSVMSVRRNAGSSANLINEPSLERYEKHRILALQAADTTVGTPLKWAVERVSTSITTWQFFFHPTADASYTFNIYGEANLIELTVDAANIPFSNPAAHGWVCRMAAMSVANLVGQPQPFIDNIGKGLPEKIQTHMKLVLNQRTPRIRPNEAVT